MDEHAGTPQDLLHGEMVALAYLEELRRQNLGATGGIKTKLYGARSEPPSATPSWKAKRMPEAIHRTEDKVGNGTSALGQVSTQYGPGLE